MKRRDFVTALFRVLASPRAAVAQQADRVRRIGFLSASAISAARLDAFRQGLRELGYVEGQSIAIEYRWAAGKYQWLPALPRTCSV